MSITPSSWDLLVVAEAVVVLLVEVVRLVVPPGDGESPLEDSVVTAGRLLGVFPAEDEVQSDSFRPISQPSCFKPEMGGVNSEEFGLKF